MQGIFGIKTKEIVVGTGSMNYLSTQRDDIGTIYKKNSIYW